MKRLKAIGDVIKEVCALKNFNKQEKLKILRDNDHPGLRTFLGYLFDETIKWTVSPGPLKYTPNPQVDCDGQLYKELRRFYLFQGGNPNLTQEKTDVLFIQLLESVTPNDAEALVAMKDHNPPKGITKKLVDEAYGA